MKRIQTILLLQNVLNQMGQDHIRNDFLTGSNGAEVKNNNWDHTDLPTSVCCCCNAFTSILSLAKCFTVSTVVTSSNRLVLHKPS